VRACRSGLASGPGARSALDELVVGADPAVRTQDEELQADGPHGTVAVDHLPGELDDVTQRDHVTAAAERIGAWSNELLIRVRHPVLELPVATGFEDGRDAQAGGDVTDLLRWLVARVSAAVLRLNFLGDMNDYGDRCDHGMATALRDWRTRRRLSQLELALRAGTTQRHVSFVEVGQSVPGRALVIRLTESLDVPLGERNRLLLAAGYALAFDDGPLNGPRLGPVRAAPRS